ncbi:MAG TPA: DASS family sodium-coupled anion symporter [Vicinamibacteria bacterium]|nr:DASS family sodium-coupled anion symporter [Vicinamibacteria bacterium]
MSVASAATVQPTPAAEPEKAAGTPSGAPGRVRLLRAAVVALAVVLWFVPPPGGLAPAAWHLFALFAAAIASVVIGALPILTASVLALAAAVLTGTVAPERAYAGFANGTILLIVVAFLVARAVVKCGLGERLGHLVVSVFGRSTLGLAYSIFLVDGVIAPAFPSNTARSGVLYPLVLSVAEAAGARPGVPGRARLGRFLMFCGMASLTLSSALWFTAMAANPLGAEIARRYGVEISFGSWLGASIVPTLVAMGLLPLVLYKVTRPEVSATPEAPRAARRALRELGPMRRDEKVVAVTFAVMVALWAAAGALGIDSTAVAFLGLAALLVTGVLSLGDIAREGDVLATYLWFAILFTISGELNEMGFMGFLGRRLSMRLGGLPMPVAGITLVVAYVGLHYLFVSQTAHLLALLGVFLEVGVKLGVPAAPLAYQLLFATNYFSANTPQGSSANLLFAGSGYLSQGELYRFGALTTAFNLAVYLVVGTPWLLLA